MMENINIKYIDIEELGTWPIYLSDIKVSEGELVLSQHLMHERNSKIATLAKKRFKEKHEGRLYCEVCGFDFFEKYGDIGKDFIEAHHKKPVSKMDPGNFTTVNDFIMVCSNCHSMLHIGKDWLSHDELRTRIKIE